MTKTLSIVVSVSVLMFVIELIRREKLTFKYAAGWIAVSILATIFSVFDSFIFVLAQSLGFELPSNFIFFSLLSFFVFLSLLMTIFLCQQNNRNDSIAQKLGILEYELKKLKEADKK